jgi:hypothetical protein
MLPVAIAVLTYLGAFFRSRNDLGFEVAALRLQLIVLKRKCPRPRLRGTDASSGWLFADWGLGGAKR